MFNCHFQGFIGSSSGLLLVSKRASCPRFAPSVPRVFRIRLINERTTKTPDFPPLACTPVNSPFEGLFVARERELEKGSSLTLLPHLLGYSSNCVSLSADLGVLTGARRSASSTRRFVRSNFRRFSRSSSSDNAFSAALRRFSASHMLLRDS